ncbi:MAG TPA: 8-amino-7-oxononanoate synthase [Solirubrobacterales bacterium]|jgi:glycine C-acetyltransferase/8-amino-7-oxononanoate synthase
MTDVAARLADLRDRGLHRRLRLVEGPQGASVRLDDREVLLLCSNNYLGLADEPRVREAAAQAALRWGAGAGASRLISGSMEPHRYLEVELAEFEGFPEAILFGSGYLANTGTIAALAGAGEVVLSDELNHASIIDGCRLSRAETRVYRHRDLEHLAWSLADAGGRAALIVTDGVFSMDGDLAPLRELYELAQRHGARLLVDDAHATGAIGPGGRGSVREAGLAGEAGVVSVGTLGKALGSYGAYVCADRDTLDYLVNAARPFIFSTAPPPAAVAAAAEALAILREQPERVDDLRRNAAVLREALAREGLAVDSPTQILPVRVGEAEPTMRLCELALERGVFAQGIRPPTVPKGTSRLRLTVMSTHTPAELEAAARTLGTAARELEVATGERLAAAP